MIYHSSLLHAFCILPIFAAALHAAPTFTELSTAIKALPSSRTLQTEGAIKCLKDPDGHVVSLNEVRLAIESASESLSKRARDGVWMGEAADVTQFDPFVERLQVTPATQLVIHGDFHGDAKSFVTVLERLNELKLMDGFRIIQPNVRLIFLGDYVDRGCYGREVLYILTQLILANEPGSILAVRGNHEDLSLNNEIRHGGFLQIEQDAGEALEAFKKSLSRFYNQLPMAIFVNLSGAEPHLLFCHGGIEPRYDHRDFLRAPYGEGSPTHQRLGPLGARDFFERNKDKLAQWPRESEDEGGGYAKYYDSVRPWSYSFYLNPPTTETPIAHYINNGFAWTDFTIRDSKWAFTKLRTGRGLEVCQTDAKLYMSDNGQRDIFAIIRAHQHSRETLPILIRLGGVFQHWTFDWDFNVKNLEKRISYTLEPDGVYLFTVSPDTPLVGQYEDELLEVRDTYGILTFGETFDASRMDVHQIEVPGLVS